MLRRQLRACLTEQALVLIHEVTPDGLEGLDLAVVEVDRGPIRLQLDQLARMRASSPRCELTLFGPPIEDLAVQAVRLGVRDYLVSPLDPSSFHRALQACAARRGLAIHPDALFRQVLGRRIRSRRHALDLSLHALAARASVGVSMLSQFELGGASPNVGTLERLARALDSTPTELVDELGPSRCRSTCRLRLGAELDRGADARPAGRSRRSS